MSRDSNLDQELLHYARHEQKPFDLKNVIWLKVGREGFLISPTGLYQLRFITGVIVWYGVVHVRRDEAGALACGSSNLIVSDVLLHVKQCDTCCFRTKTCHMNWRIVIQDQNTREYFAMTLARTSTAKFSYYLRRLRQENVTISDIQTDICIENGIRQTAPLYLFSASLRQAQTGNIPPSVL